MSQLRDLGPEFVWGAATSAYQIEGAAAEDGRTPSIWDTFSRVPGAIDNADHGDVACDHYHRMPEDVALMRELGLDAYRFSVSWSRVLPEGTGRINEAGLGFYDRLVDELLANGITPYATVYHWDLPQALQDRGGWPERDTAYRLAEFAGVLGERLGDRVADWFTINEPLCSAWIGHLEGRMAPGERDLERAVRASHHLLLGHGLSMEALRAASPGPVRVGAVLNPSPVEAASDRPEDVAAARRVDGHVNRWWMDPLFGRGYPADMVEAYGVEPPVQEGDLELIGAPADHIGINYYFRQIIEDDPQGPAPRGRMVTDPSWPVTGMDWEIHPAGLEDVLLRITDEYGARKVFVAENGSAFPDLVRADGSIDDRERTEFLEQHLAAAARAVAKGVPLAGYFAWSLMDNFEWAYGYDKRFGLVHVDYDTQVRTVKASGRRYADLIAHHRGLVRG
ncbi:GH1 family beta-glucosidase [Kitasatospora sp. NPDC048365]|uniref:GH1 family beta-glucosidase n=1 Tax=Kitasatospora sp. NPDC048365 TaxID=3364050 RepID=UPI0037163B17